MTLLFSLVVLTTLPCRLGWEALSSADSAVDPDPVHPRFSIP